VHWLLDEIQLVPDWERFVRRVLDSEKVEIAVSGSSVARAQDMTRDAIVPTRDDGPLGRLLAALERALSEIPRTDEPESRSPEARPGDCSERRYQGRGPFGRVGLASGAARVCDDHSGPRRHLEDSGADGRGHGGRVRQLAASED
jgi:hypothetical protein